MRKNSLKKIKFKLLDFRNVVAKMLGLDVNTLAVADYEIIARIERVISTFNATGILPVNVQRVQTPTPPQGSNINYEFLSSQYDSNSSIEPRQMSPTRRHHHVHHMREQSGSPLRHIHHNHNGHHNHINHNHVNDAHARHRSKSPRKNVTIIDPNSY